MRDSRSNVCARVAELEAAVSQTAIESHAPGDEDRRADLNLNQTTAVAERE